jgi:hypothetical protein
MNAEFIEKLAATLDTETLKYVLDLDMYWPDPTDTHQMTEDQQLESAIEGLMDNLRDMDDESRCETYEGIIWSLATMIEKNK